jgi:hypothetical protein
VTQASFKLAMAFTIDAQLAKATLAEAQLSGSSSSTRAPG